MDAPRLSDVARQFAIVFAAIFQIYASYAQGSQNGAIAQEIRSLVLPATYAFAIWGPIFLLCLVYAIYQGLPQHRTDAVYRASGWWIAAAFLADGVWIYAFTSRQFVLAQMIIVVGWLCATMAFLIYARGMMSGRATNVDQWIIGPAFGLLAGWLTAASFVGLAGTLVAMGLPPDGAAAERGAAALLLAAAGVAVGLILRAKPGFSPAWVAYGAAILWALLAIVVEQRSSSMLVAGAAIVGMVLVVAALAFPQGHMAPAESPV